MTLRQIAQNNQNETDRLRNSLQAMRRTGQTGTGMFNRLSGQLERADTTLRRSCELAGLTLNRFGRINN